MMFSQLGHEPLLKIAAFCQCVATITNNGSNYHATFPYLGTNDMAQPLVIFVVPSSCNSQSANPKSGTLSLLPPKARASILWIGMRVKRLQQSNAYLVNMPDAGSLNPGAPCD